MRALKRTNEDTLIQVRLGFPKPTVLSGTNALYGASSAESYSGMAEGVQLFADPRFLEFYFHVPSGNGMADVSVRISEADFPVILEHMLQVVRNKGLMEVHGKE